MFAKGPQAQKLPLIGQQLARHPQQARSQPVPGTQAQLFQEHDYLSGSLSDCRLWQSVHSCFLVARPVGSLNVPPPGAGCDVRLYLNRTSLVAILLCSETRAETDSPQKPWGLSTPEDPRRHSPGEKAATIHCATNSALCQPTTVGQTPCRWLRQNRGGIPRDPSRCSKIEQTDHSGNMARHKSTSFPCAHTLPSPCRHLAAISCGTSCPNETLYYGTPPSCCSHAMA